MPSTLPVLTLIPLPEAAAHGAELSVRLLFFQAQQQGERWIQQQLEGEPLPPLALTIRTLGHPGKATQGQQAPGGDEKARPEAALFEGLSLPAPPVLVLVWLSPESVSLHAAVLEEAAARFPKSALLGMGPEVYTVEGAGQALLRLPALQGVLREIPSQALTTWLFMLATLNTPAHKLVGMLQEQPLDAKLGLSLRGWVSRREGVGEMIYTLRHYPMPPEAETRELAFPDTWKAETPHLTAVPQPLGQPTSRRRTHGTPRPFCWLLTPYALLTPSFQQKDVTPELFFPPAQLEVSLRALARDRWTSLELWPPLSSQNKLLIQVLELLATHNPGLPVKMSLTRLPDVSFLERFRRAGVTHISYEHPTQGNEERQSVERIERSAMKSLLELDGRVELVIRFGRPGDTHEQVQKLVEQALTLPSLSIRLEPLNLPWGHPMRQDPGIAVRSCGTLLASPGWTPEQLAYLQGLRQVLLTHLERFPKTLRQLARTVELPLLSVLERLAGLSATPEPVAPTASSVMGGEKPKKQALASKDRPRQDVLELGRQLLWSRGEGHLMATLEELLTFEGWAQRPGKRVKSVTRLRLDPTQSMDDVILAVEPAVETETFVYDVVNGLKKLHLEPLPVRLTRVLALRRHGLPALVSILPERIFTQLGLVDGRKELKTLEEELSRLVVHHPADNTQEVGILGLLTRGLVYVRGRKKPEPPPPPKHNILPFRRSVVSLESHQRRAHEVLSDAAGSSESGGDGLSHSPAQPSKNLGRSGQEGTPE